VSGFDIYEALKKCEDKLIQFGGHKYAAGLTVEVSRIKEFRDAFNAAVRELITEEHKTPVLRVDTEISFADISPRFLRILKEFGPFGPSNLKPIFLARDLEVVGSPRIVGKNHLRFRARQNGRVLDAIGFGLGDLLPRIDGDRRGLSAVFTLEENDYNVPAGSREAEAAVQLRIRDIR
jgi:single-stranded-DNA-specific exonuclease